MIEHEYLVSEGNVFFVELRVQVFDVGLETGDDFVFRLQFRLELRQLDVFLFEALLPGGFALAVFLQFRPQGGYFFAVPLFSEMR